MEPNLSDFLALYDASIQKIILGTRFRLQEALPEGAEQVDLPSRIIAYGRGKKTADLVFAIAPFQHHVNLMFSQGAVLEDPQGTLVGTGKRARHIRLLAPEDASSPTVLAMLQQAVLKFYNQARG